MISVWNQITTEFYGRTVYGSYVIEEGMVKVKTPRGERRMPFVGFNAEARAEQLLRELAAQGKA